MKAVVQATKRVGGYVSIARQSEAQVFMPQVFRGENVGVSF